jgi:PAS domain S-box-containing protein
MAVAALRIATEVGPDGEHAGFIGVALDVTASKEAEQALKLSDTRIRLALTAGGITDWYWDAASDRVQFSKHSAETLGIPEDLRPTSAELAAAVHDNDRAAVIAVGEQALRDGQPYQIEYRIHRVGGSDEWVATFGSPVTDAHGKVTGVIGMSQIITGRKESEQALRESEARLRFLDALSTATAKSRNADEILSVTTRMVGSHLSISNCAYADMDDDEDGFTIRGDWAAPGSPTIVGHYSLADFGKLAVANLKAGKPLVINDNLAELEPHEAATFQNIGIAATICMPLVKEGRLTALMAIHDKVPHTWSPSELALIHEVTDRSWAHIERVGAEADLRASEASLRSLNADLERQVIERTQARGRSWQLSPDLMGALNSEGFFETSNPAWKTMLGWSESEIAKMSIFDLLHPDDRERTREGFELTQQGQPALHFPNRYRCKDGSYRWISWIGVPEDGLVYCTGRDITEEKNREAELALAQEALRQSQKLEAMGQLTGGVAHDFNNLLTPIVGSLDLLRRRGLGGEREQRMIDGALQSADRAKTLVQRLLAFARRQPLKAEAVDIGALVVGMSDLIASTLGPRVRVEIDVPSALPPATADANQVEMALLNLSVNARDAMPDGGTLTIAVAEKTAGPSDVPRLAAGRYIKLCVADTGVGMSEATLASAVEPFFSTKGVGKGTGLGLSMVHGLASQLGGAMELNSKVGEGTVVELWLPVSSECVVPRAGRLSSVERSSAGTALIVDDEELIRMSTSDMLADLGYAVVEAASGEEALDLLSNGLAPDFLITDHLMPGMTGTELARAIRNTNPNTSVLIVSGYADVEGIAPEFANLTKPFRQAELSSAIEQLISDRSAPATDPA